MRRAPLNLLAQGEGRWVIALTYGPGVPRVRNVLAVLRLHEFVELRETGGV